MVRKISLVSQLMAAANCIGDPEAELMNQAAERIHELESTLQAERERCAGIADKFADFQSDNGNEYDTAFVNCALSIAAAIRSGGE